jgi:putative FmdB family regulatory protein
MPTYEYECNACHHRFDERQGFNDEPVAVCPKCNSRSQRVFHAVPVVFKGSGFYCTDHGHGGRYDSPKSGDKADKKEPAKKDGNGSSPEASKKAGATAEKKSAASKVESTPSKS